MLCVRCFSGIEKLLNIEILSTFCYALTVAVDDNFFVEKIPSNSSAGKDSVEELSQMMIHFS